MSINLKGRRSPRYYGGYQNLGIRIIPFLFFIFINVCLLTAGSVFDNVQDVGPRDRAYAAAVANFQIGLKNNGNPVEPSHADPARALGRPEQEEGNNYVSLGFGGQIILVLEDFPLQARPNRLELVESDSDSSECEDHPERVEVYVGTDLAQDLSDWIYLGIACKGETFDISSLQQFQYVYIVDISNPDEFSAGEDGYDLNGIILTSCRDCPLSTATPLPSEVATPTLTPAPSDTPVPPTATATQPSSGSPTGTPSSEFCQANTLDVVLVMDRSESMRGQPLANAQDAAKHFVQLIPLERNQIGLVSFSSSARLEQTLTKQLALLEQAIEALEVSSGSNIAAGIELAKTELTGESHNSLAIPVMILLSDGRFDGEDPSRPAQAAKEAGIRIITVGLGRQVDESTMRSIASSSTDYYYSPTGSDLITIYQDIAQTIYCQANAVTDTPTAVTTTSNEAPLAFEQSVTIEEDQPKAIPLKGSGNENSSLTYSVIVGPIHGTLSGTAPDLTYTSTDNYWGPDSFTFVVHDGVRESAPAEVHIDITPVNDAPGAGSDFYEVLANTVLSIPSPGVLGNDTDVDGDPLTARILSSPRYGTATLSPNGSFTYVADPDFSGRDSFTYKINDGKTNSTEGTVNVDVRSDNNAPLADPQSVTILEDSTGEAITLTGSDDEVTVLTFAVISMPVNGVLKDSAPNLTYVPHSNYTGVDSFTFRVSDGVLESAPATITITVMAANDPPEALDDSYAMDEDGVLEVSNPGILNNDSDVDGDALTIIRLSNPSHGRLALNEDGSFTYMPNLFYHGPDRLTYRLNDGHVDSNIATISINIGSTNNTPLCLPEVKPTVEAGKSVDLSPSCTDPDKDILEYRIVTFPEHGTLSVSPGTLTYTPDAHYSGLDSFGYLVNDGTSDSNVAIAHIVVTPASPPPLPKGWPNIDTINNIIDLFLKIIGGFSIFLVTVILAVPPSQFWRTANLINKTPELRRAIAVTPLFIFLGLRIKQHHYKAVVKNRKHEWQLRSELKQTPRNEFTKISKLTYDMAQNRQVTKRLIAEYKRIRQQIEKWRHG